MALNAVKELLSLDGGSLVSYQLDKNSHLDSISFQTILMRDIFLEHPEVVLIHRTHSPWGKALYVFMVDKPFLKLEGELAKVIHLAVPAKESAEGLARLYHTFKVFNPEWKQIKTFLVDPRFRLLPTLSKAFPSADVQLSVFHICKHLQQKIRHVSLAFHTERLLLSVLRNAMCAPSESNLRKMHTILSDFVKPNLLPQLHTNWLLNEKIWSMHRWRTWEECSQYFKDQEMITRNLSQVFCAGLPLESSITRLAKTYQKKVLKGSWEARPGQATLLSQNISSLPHLVVLNSSAPSAQRPLRPRDPPAAAPQSSLVATQEASAKEAMCKQEAVISDEEASACIRQSLSTICTEPAARLCLSELAMVQSSECLMGSSTNTISVQILEDTQVVLSDRSLDSCTCHFSQTFQLPCRHSLAVLNSEGKAMEPERVPEQWRKGHSPSQPEQRSTSDPLDALRSSWDSSLDKYLSVSFLTAEISRLLSQCSSEEFDRRCSTLRELADSWIGPYEQVKL